LPATQKKSNDINSGQLINECIGVDYKVQEVVIPSGTRTTYVKHSKRYVFVSVLTGKAVLIGDGLPTDLITGRSVAIPRKTKYMFINESEEDFRILFTEYGSVANPDDVEVCDDSKIPKKYREEE
tara:strand:- start:32 stop:406 length:375 start_codon:yes stop_codon:yes gene_type:complete